MFQACGSVDLGALHRLWGRKRRGQLAVRKQGGIERPRTEPSTPVITDGVDLAEREHRPEGILETYQLSKAFQGVQALRQVSLRVDEERIVGLIGPNGSGKTTLLNVVSGVFTPTAGSVRLDGRSISGWQAHRVASAGIVRTFQNIRLFQHLTASENVQASAVAAGGLPRNLARPYARTLLEELGIARHEHAYARTLPYGSQRRLEIARALAARPRFLLLDEPTAGMNETESRELGETLERIRSVRGCGILLVEHDLRVIMRFCAYLYVLNEGSLISHGAPVQVRRDPIVIAAYIGEEADV